MADITISVADSKLEDLSGAFISRFPPPSDWSGSSLQWTKLCVIRWIQEQYRAGKVIQASESMDDVVLG